MSNLIAFISSIYATEVFHYEFVSHSAKPFTSGRRWAQVVRLTGLYTSHPLAERERLWPILWVNTKLLFFSLPLSHFSIHFFSEGRRMPSLLPTIISNAFYASHEHNENESSTEIVENLSLSRLLLFHYLKFNARDVAPLASKLKWKFK